MVQQTEKKLSLKPLGNRVVAQRVEQEESLKGGIVLPDSAKKKQETARVVAVGPGALTKEGNHLPMPVKVGDMIVVDKYAAQEFSIEGVEYIFVKADDIMGTLI